MNIFNGAGEKISRAVNSTRSSFDKEIRARRMAQEDSFFFEDDEKKSLISKKLEERPDSEIEEERQERERRNAAVHHFFSKENLKAQASKIATEMREGFKEAADVASEQVAEQMGARKNPGSRAIPMPPPRTKNPDRPELP